MATATVLQVWKQNPNNTTGPSGYIPPEPKEADKDWVLVGTSEKAARCATATEVSALKQAYNAYLARRRPECLPLITFQPLTVTE